MKYRSSRARARLLSCLLLRLWVDVSFSGGRQFWQREPLERRSRRIGPRVARDEHQVLKRGRELLRGGRYFDDAAIDVLGRRCQRQPERGVRDEPILRGRAPIRGDQLGLGGGEIPGRVAALAERHE